MGKDLAVQNVHRRVENLDDIEFPPRMDPQAAALPAVFAAADADPLRAAVDAVAAAIATFGKEYPHLLRELREAFPQVR